MNAFKHQQHRWTKGGAQTCVKLLPRILASKLPLAVKIEAWFHLTGCFTYVLMVMLTLLCLPALCIQTAGGVGAALVDAGLFLLASCSASTFYLCSQQEIYRNWRDKIKYLPFLMSLGAGISLSNTKAVLEVLFGRKSEFVRTPKFGANSIADQSWKKRAGKIGQKVNWLPYAEFLLGCYVAVCIYLSVSYTGRVRISLPFLCMFMFGYFYVALTTWFSGRPAPHALPRPDVAAQPAPAEEKLRS